MDNQAIILTLANLVQLDVDAINSYEQAIKNVDHGGIRGQLEKFRGDHERHVKELSAIIRRLGGDPPIAEPGISGFFLETFTELRSITGSEGALKAMRMNEGLTNGTYQAALEYDLPADIRKVVEGNYQDEKRHLAYIEQVLEDRRWEERAKHTRA